MGLRYFHRNGFLWCLMPVLRVELRFYATQTRREPNYLWCDDCINSSFYRTLWSFNTVRNSKYGHSAHQNLIQDKSKLVFWNLIPTPSIGTCHCTDYELLLEVLFFNCKPSFDFKNIIGLFQCGSVSFDFKCDIPLVLSIKNLTNHLL